MNHKKNSNDSNLVCLYKALLSSGILGDERLREVVFFLLSHEADEIIEIFKGES